MKKRLQTILSAAGAASRRSAAELIESGRVKVDGRPVLEKGFKLDPAKHKILVDSRPLPEKEKKYYFLLNKPRGVISTAKDTHNRRKVTDFFKRIKGRLYPVGRLDKDTTGIILLTNDGELTHRLTHPRFEVDKEYTVKINGGVSPRRISELGRGIDIDGKATSPCKIRIIRKDGEDTILKIKIHEGRKRQVRRMFEAIGRRVIELDRVKYAGLELGRLRRGEFRRLSRKEIERLITM